MEKIWLKRDIRAKIAKHALSSRDSFRSYSKRLEFHRFLRIEMKENVYLPKEGCVPAILRLIIGRVLARTARRKARGST